MEDLKIRLEKFDDVIEELEPLLEDQLQETEPQYVKDGVELDPDYDLYRLLEDRGNLFVAVLRLQREVIGYFMLIRSPHLHHKLKEVVTVDIMYIKPEHRHGEATGILMDFMVGLCNLMEVDWLRVAMKENKKFEGLLESYDFVKDEVTYKLTLGGQSG